MIDSESTKSTRRYTPRGLGKAGKKLWADIASEWDLRPDEFRILEDAARTADLIDVMDDVLTQLPADQLVVNGSRNQPVAHPFIAEVRQCRATLAGLLRQLRLSEEESGAGSGDVVPMSRSEKARKAANARWAR